MLSFKSLYTRTTGKEMTVSQLKEMEIKEAQQLYRAGLTKPDATGIRTVEQNNGPEGTGHGLVPPVPFGSMLDGVG